MVSLSVLVRVYPLHNIKYTIAIHNDGMMIDPDRHRGIVTDPVV